MVSLTRRIAEGTAHIALANFITIIFNLLSFIVVVRLLGKFEYGLIVLSLSAVNILSTFLDFGIGGVMTSDIAKELKNNRKDRVKSLLYRYTQIEILAGIILFLSVLGISEVLSPRYQDTVIDLIRISSVIILLNALKNIFVTTFNSHLDFKSIFYMNSFESAFRLFYIIILGVYMNLGIYGVMASYPASSATSIALTLRRYVKIAGEYLRVTRSKEGLFFNTITSHGKWVAMIRPIKNISGNIPPWIIQSMLGVEAVAIFNVARRAANYVILFLTPLENVLMPIISQESNNIGKVNSIISRSIKYSIWASAAIIIVGVISSEWVFYTLFGAKYLKSSEVFNVLIFISLSYSLNLVMRPVFFALRLQKHLFMIYVKNLLVFILLALILTAHAGLKGMALAFILSGFAGFAMRYSALRRSGVKIHFSNLFKIDRYDIELINKIYYRMRKR